MTYIKIFKTINFAVPSEIESEEVEIFRELLFIATCGNVFGEVFYLTNRVQMSLARTLRRRDWGTCLCQFVKSFFFARPGCRRVKHMFR